MNIPPNPCNDPDPHWYTDLGRNFYRFDPEGPKLRIMRKDGTPSDAFIAVEYRKDLADYAKLPMSETCRARLVQWFRDEDKKPF